MSFKSEDLEGFSLIELGSLLQELREGQLYFSDGYYWHPIQENHLHRSFKYMSLEDLRNAVGELVDDGLLMVGDYQIEMYELENWYTMPKFQYSRDLPLVEAEL